MTHTRPLITAFDDLFVRHAPRDLFLGDDGRRFLYGDVLRLAQTPEFTGARRAVVLCLLDNVPGALLGYLALMSAQAVPMNVAATLSEGRLAELLARYRPEFAWLPQSRLAEVPGAEVRHVLEGHCLVALPSDNGVMIHGDLALLLSTSGSTGSPKFVRLSQRNVLSNALAIADYLALTPEDRPVTSLPPHYTYGLSVIHSHLVVGSTIALTDKSLFDRGFWDFMKSAGVSSFAGVPYHYDMLRKLRFWRQDLPALRLLTQAGGRMDPQVSLEMAQESAARGIRYVTMYGQVEATARMAYLPPELAVAKAGSIGLAIPGGSLHLEDEAGAVITAPDVAGHLVYRGDNVSLGYAQGREDLARGDEHQGVLRTGDIARRDADGCFQIVGRQKRFLKLFGHRVNLEDIELDLQRTGAEVACGGQDDQLKVYVVGASAADCTAIKAQVVASLKVHPSAVVVLALPALPRSDAGKVQYALLDAQAAEVLA